MISKNIYSIFKQGSRTYFYSSLFFPPDVKADVFSLYSFVRTADDFVDQQPPKKKDFLAFRKEYSEAIRGKKCTNEIIQAFVLVAKKRQFDPKWTETFLDTMESDLHTVSYADLTMTERYMYGSAEVIGLMMSNILELPMSARPFAQKLGRSMQYVNFIRDISEDIELGRNYFPQSDMKKYGLKSLEYDHVARHSIAFAHFMKAQLKRYQTWQETGKKGYDHIPKRYLIPIKTASDLYNWTATQIAKDPMVVYQRKMKPPAVVIALTLLKNIVTIR